MKIYDLSGPIENGMWSYGAPFPPEKIERLVSVEKDGYSAHNLQIHVLSGTYVENASHLFEDRATIDHVPLNRFITRAWVAQLPDKSALEPITAEELEAAVGDVFQPGDALLVSTGWDKYWNKPEFDPQSPFFSAEAAGWVVDKDVSILGVDITHYQDPRNDDGSLQRNFFAKDRLMMSPLVNLRTVEGKGPFTLIALPLNIPGVCATPSRVVLLDKEI